MPTNLRKLVEVFNAPEYPMFAFKWTSTKIGAEITMALAMSYGEEIN
jgi:hypothetical protein